ncbi:MAG: hypothetical protein KIT43_10385 [Bauldia sp.]|nr:hypothetical protein [Bauldia sp.]MCW5719333.1 hypothetical protein [Bauldia sp.]
MADIRTRLGRFARHPGASLLFRLRSLRHLRPAERIPFALLRPVRRLRRRHPVHTLGFVPDVPVHFDYAIRRVCDLLGLRMAKARPGTSPVVVWADSTEVTLPVPAGAVNARCVDIRKSTVERIFRETFGYGYAVDPLRHHGPMLRKSEQNATHDGVVLAGPLAAKDSGFVYQRLIDNLKNGKYEDLRIPIVRGEIPVVFIRRLPPQRRFGAVATEAGVNAPEEVLSPDERSRLAAFAAAIGLDFGEVDAIRDRDGVLYVVDANKTPVGPPRRLTMRERISSMQLIADAFQRQWLDGRAEVSAPRPHHAAARPDPLPP